MADRGNCCHQPSIMMRPLDSQDKDAVDTYDEGLALVTPLPRRELFLIWIIHASQGFQTTMLFPMLVFMVEKYGMAGKDSHTVGYYAGLLASLFPLAQFCTSVLWGVISDRYGRRPWLAFGNSVSAASSLLLGLSQTFANACFIRFLGGLLNGTMTITKSTLAELCDGTNQATGFGILNLAWGIGAIAGPVVSGVLAEPCVQYKPSHCPVFLQTHPFVLPCLSATLFSSIAVFAALTLKETNPRIDVQKLPYQKIPSQVYDPDDEGDSASSESQTKEGQLFKATLCSDLEMELESDYQISQDISREQRLLILISTQQQEEEDTISKTDLGCTAPCLASIDRATADSSDLPDSNSLMPTPTAMSILKDRDVLLSSFCYSMTGLIFIITDELFPMFGASSKTIGGLGFSSADLGIILGEGGLVLFVYTLVLYPQVAKSLGPLRCFRYGILGSVPLWLLFPACSMIAGHPTLLWSLLLFTMAARSVVGCTTFTGVLILVSNSATPENMGTVTGLSHSFCSFFRAIGPAFGGAVWSYTSTKNFPMHQFLAWAFVALLSICTFGISYLLPPTLVRPKVNNR